MTAAAFAGSPCSGSHDRSRKSPSSSSGRSGFTVSSGRSRSLAAKMVCPWPPRSQKAGLKSLSQIMIASLCTQHMGQIMRAELAHLAADPAYAAVDVCRWRRRAEAGRRRQYRRQGSGLIGTQRRCRGDEYATGGGTNAKDAGVELCNVEIHLQNAAFGPEQLQP